MKILAGLVVMIAMLLPMTAWAATPAEVFRYIPRNAYLYDSYVIRQARAEMGMEAPVALFAGQLHQESHWNLRAKSAYASGLSQFTPDTEKWIIGLFPDLGTEGVQDPKWAIRAMVRYDKWLLNKTKSPVVCDDWAKTLSAYNGGLGWVYRDEKLATKAGKDASLWWGNVELYSGRAPQFIKENRDYPLKILIKHQPMYLQSGRWGTTQICTERMPEALK